jgi:DNA-binding transcriptional MerR regulator
MNPRMTIQAFSVRTGLPPSTLRYYEKERLLIPSFRGDNGYRLYTSEQIPLAVTIHSLRQADVNLSDIQKYLLADDTTKVEWVRKWRKEIDSKMASLRVAWQFLHGIEPEDQHIRLVKWEAPVRLLWYHLRVKRGLQPFREEIEKKADLLQSNTDVRIYDAFVRSEQIEMDEITGKVGFRFSGPVPISESLVSGLQTEVEIIEPTLFVTLESMADDEYACFNVMLLLQFFGFEPSGPFMERYELSDMSSYHWMVPVIQAGSYS